MPELIEKRTRNSKTHSLGGRKFAVDASIGSIHYEDNGWQDIDNYFEPAVSPWDWQILHAGYHIRVKEDFTAGQIIEFEKQGETVQFQPMALEWTNDLDQIQPISMPQNVSPVITNPEVGLLPAVGMPSRQGTIRWNDAYGSGIDFEWHCQSTRLAKRLEIESLNKLPVPQQYILDGGNPVLRLNLIFDPPSKNDVDIVVDGQVWNQSSKKQTFKAIEFRKDGEVLWGFMPLRYWGSNPEAEDNEEQSVATLEKRGNKLYISIRVPYGWLQSAVYPIFIDPTVESQPASGSDDANERGDNGLMKLDDIHIVYGSSGGQSYAGTRHIITIPSGMVIITAYLIFIARVDDSGSFTSDFWAEDGANPGTFTSATSNISGRTPTTLTVPWDNPESWTSPTAYNSPELKTIIQELYDSYDYSSGAAMVIINLLDSGTGERLARSYEYVSGYAPKLHIEYEEVAVGQPYISRVQGVQGMRSWGGI